MDALGGTICFWAWSDHTHQPQWSLFECTICPLNLSPVKNSTQGKGMLVLSTSSCCFSQLCCPLPSQPWLNASSDGCPWWHHLFLSLKRSYTSTTMVTFCLYNQFADVRATDGIQGDTGSHSQCSITGSLCPSYNCHGWLGIKNRLCLYHWMI